MWKTSWVVGAAALAASMAVVSSYSYGGQTAARQPISSNEDGTTMQRTVALLSLSTSFDNSTIVPEGRIVEVDRKKGVYLFQWVGHDGKTKSIEYTRPDSARAIVSASVHQGQSKRFRYRYELRNLADSGNYISGFIIQTFVTDVQPIGRNDAYIGQMGSHVDTFEEGAWWAFGNQYFSDGLEPGSTETIELESDFPPAIVGCKIYTGPMKMMGVGEDLPSEFVDLLPGYEAWPSGFTIGPSDSPQLQSFDGRREYLLSQLDNVSQYGWLTSSTAADYRQLLGSSVTAKAIHDRLIADFSRGMVLEEVAAILFAGAATSN